MKASLVILALVGMVALMVNNFAPVKPAVKVAVQEMSMDLATHLLNPQIAFSKEFWQTQVARYENLQVQGPSSEYSVMFFLALCCTFVTLAIHLAMGYTLVRIVKQKLVHS